MADQPAPVRLYHPSNPGGVDFDPVTARTMRRQGWTDGAGELDPDQLAAMPTGAPPFDPQLDGLPDPPTTAADQTVRPGESISHDFSSTPPNPDTLNPEATDG